jgi:S-adenosylmethionine/arginine decarboxylase-like enzyme
MGVDEKYTEKFSTSYKILSRLIEVLLEDDVMGSSMHEEEDHFVGFCYSKMAHATVCGYHDRNLVTVDIRCPESIDMDEVSDWLIHEYRPTQCIITSLTRGATDSSADTRTKKIRSTVN